MPQRREEPVLVVLARRECEPEPIDRGAEGGPFGTLSLRKD